MGVSVWKSAGASVRGPGHIRAALPNQDAWMHLHRTWGDIVVVSDGVGSCIHAGEGAKAVCKAVVLTSKQLLGRGRSIDAVHFHSPDHFLNRVHENWLKLIEPLSPRDCQATCLFALVRHRTKEVFLGMLGDGLVAAVKADGSIVTLAENKGEMFSNQTTAMSRNTNMRQWCFTVVPQKDCRAIILCTDGVADDLLQEKRDDFVRQWVVFTDRLAAVTIGRRICRMLTEWPTPGHTDDKTMACLYRARGDT